MNQADVRFNPRPGDDTHPAHTRPSANNANAPRPALIREVIFLILLISGICPGSHAQSPSADSTWSANISLINYIFTDDYIIMPVVQAGINRLHLEARYNYEDLKTASLFGGYDFEIGDNVTLDVTPMLGVAFGQTTGIIPAIELTLAFGAFSIYNESEFLVSTSSRDESFFYSWTEFLYSPLPWLDVGIVATRTRLYDTALDLQRGFGAGITAGSFGITGYLMNAGFDTPFGYLSAWASF